MIGMNRSAQPATFDASLLKPRITYGDAGVQLVCPCCEVGVLVGDSDTAVRCDTCSDTFHVCQCGGDDTQGCHAMLHDDAAIREAKHLMDGGEFYCAESRRMNDELGEWARDSHEWAAE